MDGFQAFITLVESRLPIPCPGVGWSRALGEISLNDGIARIEAADDFQPGWAYWLLVVMADTLSDAHRQSLCRRIAHSPVWACRAWRKVDISEAERAILDGWQPHLPKM